MTIKEALEHPWLRKFDNDERIGTKTIYNSAEEFKIYSSPNV